MLETVLSLLISFIPMWMGRDKLWAPTFKGEPHLRFVQGMQHYQRKMGIQEELVFQLHPDSRFPGDAHRCSSVESAYRHRAAPKGFDSVAMAPHRVVVVEWWGKGKGCSSVKPEIWALHEACHLRFQHHRGVHAGSTKLQEEETRECMKLYSNKERR